MTLFTYKNISLGTQLDDLPTVLNLLTAPNVKKLCKDMNIQAKGTQKQDSIEALLSHSKRKSFFAVKSNSIAGIMLKKYEFPSISFDNWKSVWRSEIVPRISKAGQTFILATPPVANVIIAFFVGNSDSRNFLPIIKLSHNLSKLNSIVGKSCKRSHSCHKTLIQPFTKHKTLKV